ncbi:MAG: ribonuclease R family protein [Terriglobia bacterium]
MNQPEVFAEEVLARLRDSPYPLSLRELASRLELHGSQRKQLKKALQRLQQTKRVVEVGGNRYLLAERHRHRTSAPRATPREVGTGHGPRVTGQEVQGRLVCHRDGYGFVIPDKPIPEMEGDIFIPPPALGDAMHGDRVAVRLAPRRGARMEGRISRVLDRAHPTLVGQFHFAPTRADHNYVQPYDTRILQPVFIPAGEEIPGGYPRPRQALAGAMVNVELTRFPSATSPARGRVVEVLGHTGDLGLDVKVIIRKYHLPDEFPPEVLREAERTPQTVDPAAAARREDFRALPIVTIDGEDAKDFDDAVYVERLAGGHWLLHVHIADVSHYVRPASAFDREARLRGTSVYFPDRALPMLPLELSTGICSLNPKVDRLVLSVLMEIDGHGRILRYRFAEGLIRSAARMTYSAVNAILEGDADLRAQYGPLAAEFEKMRELALILNAARERRGSIDFDLPEPVLRFDPQGQIAAITRSERNIANRLIEEFMLAANETVACFLAARVAALYRVHERPEPRKVLEFEEIAASFGYSLGLPPGVMHRVRLGERPGRRRGHGRRERTVEIPERLDVTPRHYQRLTQQIAGKPEERILAYLMLRSLRQARYAEENLGHFALATDCYTHFTSPIRRYPDLIIHRLLRACLKTHDKFSPSPQAPAWGESAHGPSSTSSVSSVPLWFTPSTQPGKPASSPEAPASGKSATGPLKKEELRAIAIESSEAERRADDAERELINLKKLDFMEQHLGDHFDALIISITKYGFWVELFDLFVEGFVPGETLEATVHYSFHEAPPRLLPRRQSRGARAPSFHLGDRVRVRLDRIDRARNKLQFSALFAQGESA